MKILYEFQSCGPFLVSEGYRHVFEALGHEFRYWDAARQPAFDAFSEFSPDLFMGRTFATTRAVDKCIRARPEMKVVMYASAWGDLIDEIDPQKYPIVITTGEEKERLEKLKKDTGKPDFVWLHYTDEFLEKTLGGWRAIGIKPVSLLNAADTFDYQQGSYREELACDIGFVGGYWAYKARNLNPYLVSLCHPSKGLKVKIFGNQPWPVAQYLGTIETPLVKDLFVSATVCPNVSEPHSTDFHFDLIERPFKALAAGGFVVSDYVRSFKDDVFTNNEVVFADSPADFEEKIRHFIRNPQERVAYVQRGQKTVYSQHTYFNRAMKIFVELGLHKEAKAVEDFYYQNVIKPREHLWYQS